MMHLAWTPKATKQLQKLPRNVSKRITNKMEWYSQQADPLDFAEPLQGTLYGNFRFRIGTFRIFCDIENGEARVLLVLSIKKRDPAYD